MNKIKNKETICIFYLKLSFFQLQYCRDDLNNDFVSLWNKVGENARSLTLYFIPLLNILKLLKSCHNLELVDLQLYSFGGKWFPILFTKNGYIYRC